MKTYNVDEVALMMRKRGIYVALTHQYNALRELYLVSKDPNYRLLEESAKFKKILWDLNSLIQQLENLLPNDELGFTKKPR